jgi:hypothetical protein
MFICKFNQVDENSSKFKPNRHGEMPFIGTVMAGVARGTLIDGTMFQREGLEPNKLYACENTKETYEGKDQWRVQVISEVTVLEYVKLQKELGAGKLLTETIEDPKVITPETTGVGA